jgi:hypothetical protein
MALRTLNISKDSPLHKDLIGKLTDRVRLAETGVSIRYDKWRQAEERVLAYITPSEADNVRANKRENDGEPKYTNIMLPYTYGILMAAHTYWTSVFFARDPVHQFAGLHGETEMQVQALEALIAYQVEIGEMMAPYYIWLYDAGKYGHGVLGHYWCEEKIAYGEIAEFDLGDGKGPQLYQATHEVDGYKGNRVYNVSPYDFMTDPRVPMTRFQDGEFCVAKKRLGWNQIMLRKQDGYYVNIEHLSKGETVDRQATQGSPQLPRPDFTQQFFNSSSDLKHPAGAVFNEVYIRLQPKEWGLGDSMYPQIWCLTVTEGLDLIVGASPLGYIYDKFPFDVLEPEIEGYGIYNRGLPEIMEGIQNTMDWLVNTHFFNVRASMNNQFIVDPSKLVIKDATNSHQPGFVWRLRPEAYGTDISKMFMQIPVQDATRTHFADVQNMFGVGEKAIGVNDQIMGALTQGGRRTATEVRTSTGFGVNRQKTITEYMSHSGFSRHARKLVQTSQQFYRWEAKMRIVGDLAQAAGQNFVNVKPSDIAGYFSAMPVDGALPADRMAQANMWKEILIGATRLPPVIQETYDFAKIFSWMASLGGLKNINQMKVQMMPDEQLAGMVANGNAIPMMNPSQMRLPAPATAPGQGSPSASTTAGLNAMMPQPPAGADYG